MNNIRQIISIPFLLLAMMWPGIIQGRTITMDRLIPDFCQYIETQPYFNTSSINEESDQIEQHIKDLENWKDKKAYIEDKHLIQVIDDKRDSLDHYRSQAISLTHSFMNRYNGYTVLNEQAVVDSIVSILDDKLAMRENNVRQLEDCVNGTLMDKGSIWNRIDWRLIGLCAWLSLMAFALAYWFIKASRKNRSNRRNTSSFNDSQISPEEASKTIIVRRKTTAILKTQSLEDVIDNPAYKVIDCKEFCQESAVRRIYIKNTCIKDVYTMYAEDLRNPDNPKEDGCMILGRWVLDNETNEYYVSLEHIVLPGDDAIFSEYELNFGGKIKLKVADKLRRLRRETNLQYDLTCWVHSHPGLGVFFSNSDANVQMQLKHSTHPNFLTAIVVDILTPNQELGIFTFKPDSSINSKAELTRLYSLEELYQWAVESERTSFNRDNHYDCLSNAKSHTESCNSIQLNNSSIIDMGMLVSEPVGSFVGMIQGYPHQEGLKAELVATKVTKDATVPDNELVGCFITTQHCSIPTVRKAVGEHINKIKFVLVYSASDGMLTTVPVIDKALSTDENYYSEHKFEDLKIWTRRKR